MGLTKQYLAYRAIDSFNIITSGRANVNFAIVDKTEGRYVAAPAAENVIVWDLRWVKHKWLFYIPKTTTNNLLPPEWAIAS